MRLLLLLLISTLTLQVSHSQDFTVRGFLINKSDGEPIPFEKIKLLNIDSTAVSGAITDVNGFYQISKLKRRNYIIKAEAFSYITQLKQVNISDGKKIYNINFELEKQKDIIDIEEMSVNADSKRKKTQVDNFRPFL